MRHAGLQLLGLTILLGLFGCAMAAAQVETPPAETIYRGGAIITMDDDRPMAEAVAVRGGRIVAVGNADEVMRLAGQETRIVELGDRSLLPGFVDSHGHGYVLGIQATTANLLPPPDGPGVDIPALQALLRDWADANAEAIERVGWIAGFGYDDAQLGEGRHPTRDDLDAVSTDVPIIIIHQSGHLGVANSRALELAGVTAETEDPRGGVFRRRAGSREPNGVCEEYAFFAVLSKLSERFDDEVNEYLVVRGIELAASFGYTTVQEGRAMQPALDAMARVAARGELPVDLVAYPDVLVVERPGITQDYRDHFRVGGVKLTIDGSPQGKTAWLTEPYFVPPEGRDADYAGYPAVRDGVAKDAVKKAYANGWQILCHANGDAAIDLFIEAVAQAQATHPDVDNRPVLIHGQTLRKDQVVRLDELGIFPSLFPMHTFYWGDWHRESVLGPTRADDISPTGWLMERGMMFGTHHDAPVALPDSMRVLSATVTRRSRSGDIIGPVHRVPVATALKAMTLWPAWQHFEEDSKGSIEVGKLADFVILSADPLQTPEEDLAGLRVLETIKAGRTVYERPEGNARLSSPALFGLAGVHEHAPSPFARYAPLCGDGCFARGLSLLHGVYQGAGAIEATERPSPK
ncbi:MAG: amidohydrolase [Phycisphaerales bacterium]